MRPGARRSCGQKSPVKPPATAGEQAETPGNLMDLLTKSLTVPRPSKGCFLEAFEYLKTTKRHPLEGAGLILYV